MSKKYDLSYLDIYIHGEDLTSEELELIEHYPLKTFAYQLEDSDDFDLIREKLVELQNKMYGGWCLEEVRYILDKTKLTNPQKFKLRRLYKRGSMG